MRLTNFTDYALRMLLMMAARPNDLITIAEVARYFAISEAHLMKVTHALGKSGWVETVRGRNGGMRLMTDPAKLSLADLIAYLEGDFALAECFTSANTCRLTGACGLERALGEANRAFMETLKQHTLASLVHSTPSLCNAKQGVEYPRH